jgi:uncharacterized protein YkwD
MTPAQFGPFTIVDGAVILFVLLVAWNGYRTGFLIEVAGLARIAAAVFAAARFYSIPAAWLSANTQLPLALANLIGFIAVFVVTQVLVSIVYAFTVYPAVNFLHRVPGLGGIDRVLGIVPAAVQALFWAALALTALLLLPTSAQVRTQITQSALGNALVVDLSSLEPKLQALLGNAAQSTLLYLTPPATPTEGNVQLHFPPDLRLTTDAPAEQTMVAYVNAQRTQRGLAAYVNAQRTQRGLAALRSDPTLTAVARAHSTDMFRRSYFSHNTPDGLTPFDRMHAAGITYTSAGENIAYAPNVNIADTGLMNSPEHRANILNPLFTRLGVGIVSGGLFEEMFTQDFAD